MIFGNQNNYQMNSYQNILNNEQFTNNKLIKALNKQTGLDYSFYCYNSDVWLNTFSFKNTNNVTFDPYTNIQSGGSLCDIYSCGGQTLTVSVCNSKPCKGTPLMRLYDTYYYELAVFSFTCGSSCKSRSINLYEGCQIYTLFLGCLDTTSCTFEVFYNISKTVPEDLTNYPISSTITCPSYQTGFTNGSTNFAIASLLGICQFYICPGVTITISNCEGKYCYGFQSYGLYLDSLLLASSSGGCGPCGYLQYYADPNIFTSCQLVTLQQGCAVTTSNPYNSYHGEYCAGITSISNISLSSIQPTSIPTNYPAFPSKVTCEEYSSSYTNFASISSNVVNCTVPIVCPGYQITIGNCGSGCIGDQAISLYHGDELLDSNDDGCEGQYLLCSKLSYVYTGSSCVNLTIWQGCSQYSTCAGIMTIEYSLSTLSTSQPSVSHTYTPLLLTKSMNVKSNDLLIAVVSVVVLLLVFSYLYYFKYNKKVNSAFDKWTEAYDSRDKTPSFVNSWFTSRINNENFDVDTSISHSNKRNSSIDCEMKSFDDKLSYHNYEKDSVDPLSMINPSISIDKHNSTNNNFLMLINIFTKKSEPQIPIESCDNQSTICENPMRTKSIDIEI